jgi:hypothetical protein
MILTDYHFFRDTREDWNLVIDYESKSKTSRFECSMHHSVDKWRRIFEFRSLSCASQLIVEWLSMKKHSFRSCEKTRRRRAMWISIRRDLSSHLMSWRSSAESISNRFQTFSQRWLHIVSPSQLVTRNVVTVNYVDAWVRWWMIFIKCYLKILYR